jgi:hypothetical protein
LECPALKTALEELTRIYHSENASYFLHVPRIDDAGVKYSGQPDEKQEVHAKMLNIVHN